MQKEQKYIDILQAYINGETLEFRIKSSVSQNWSVVPKPSWDFESVEYRVKQKPKELWMIKGESFIFYSEKDIIDYCCRYNISITEIKHFKEVIE